MADIFEITRVCPTCNGDGLTPSYPNLVSNGEVQPVSEVQVACTRCVDGKEIVYTVELTQLDEIITKLNAIWDVLPEGWKP